MKSRFRAFFLALAAAAAAACAADPVPLPQDDAQYVGALAEFLQVPTSPGHPVRVLIERPGTAAPADKAIVHVSPETRVRIRERGQVREGSIADLTANDQLHVWTTGVELRSYPVQVHAVQIHIIR